MPVDPVAANSTATSGWANSVSTSVNDIEGDIYAAGQLAIPWTALTGKPATFAPITGPAVASTVYGQAKADGVSAAASHADHVHGTPPLPTPAQLAIQWTDIGGKPATFAPSAHKASHAAGGADAIAPGDIKAPAAYTTPATAATFRVYVGTATPTGMSEGDIWIKG